MSIPLGSSGCIIPPSAGLLSTPASCCANAWEHIHGRLAIIAWLNWDSSRRLWPSDLPLPPVLMLYHSHTLWSLLVIRSILCNLAPFVQDIRRHALNSVVIATKRRGLCQGCRTVWSAISVNRFLALDHKPNMPTRNPHYSWSGSRSRSRGNAFLEMNIFLSFFFEWILLWCFAATSLLFPVCIQTLY
jgi:hypothetical protein